MRKQYVIFFLACIMLLTACGAAKEETTEETKLGKQEIWAYYVNQEKTDLVVKPYKVNDKAEIQEQVKGLMEHLQNVKVNEEYQSPIPKGITFVENDIKIKQGKIELEFQIVYDQIDAETLLFFKACVAKSFLQLKNVYKVAISLTDITNSDPDTATVTENFDEESFNLSFGNANGYSQKGTIILYFANAEGDLLREYHKVVEISNNTSLAKIVVESLIEGPQQEGYTVTIPQNTTIQNISVKDGICYIDFSDEFYNTDNPLKNDVIIYAIVNSLCELPTVSKVQFLKNGEKMPFY
ncbi:MAG: GerMN domain-containing protein, partial [Lachnospiraceae bacterium]|nr:GerMN domain-containing protein [Lachnospiraceae bacterium]